MKDGQWDGRSTFYGKNKKIWNQVIQNGGIIQSELVNQLVNEAYFPYTDPEEIKKRKRLEEREEREWQKE